MNRRPSVSSQRDSHTIRYAVVGLGHIAQAAILPAFAHAKKNSELAALISSDAGKLKKLGKQYRVTHLGTYDDYEAILEGGEIDAVYLTLPNNLHRDYTVRAARSGIHVLCEKPMAVTTADCRAMIDACRRAEVKLMIAYRLHFEEANLKAVRLAGSGRLGEVRLFNSTFSQQVREGDIRLEEALGGGPLYDIGIYCINAARYLFREEPVEVSAVADRGDDPRFDQVPEVVGCALRFPGGRLATFICSFGAADVNGYRIVGTKGSLQVDPAYTYTSALRHRLTVGGKTQETTFTRRDQFAPELLYFSDCILKDREPEPSGEEGRIDLEIIEALQRSIQQNGRAVRVTTSSKQTRPSLE